MKYMLLIYGTEENWNEDERDACIVESMKIVQELAAEGKCLAASPLHPVSTATCVRVRAGKRQITDGPFAETTEQLGGYYILDVDNLDEAIAIASRLPPAKKGTVEIRPIQEPQPAVPFRRELSIHASPEKVYHALTTRNGIQGWWTKTCEVAEEAGGEMTVRFGETFKTFRIERLVPNAGVRWHCVGANLDLPEKLANPAEWVGTTIDLRLESNGTGGTRLSLEHTGLTPQIECYEVCCAGWDQFLASLRQYCETGKGNPF